MATFQGQALKDINNIFDENKAKLKKLGYNEWFEAKYKESNDNFPEDSFSIARVIEVNKNNYKISNGKYEISAELSGRFLFTIESSIEYPTVGDWVVIQCFDDYSLAIIHHILPRKSLLKRKESGKAVDFQLIAANIDYALIMQAVDSNFNLNRLERYFVMINESKIQPIVILSKTDLISEDELSGIIDSLKRFGDKYLSLTISNVSGEGIAALQDELQANKTYCLLGSSGVGKTSLLNTLLNDRLFKVSQVREKDSKGRHTTVRRQLICLESGSIFIDTPGMRELGNFSINKGLNETFDEIFSLSAQCRFKDCTHTHEKGCAVQKAVDSGLITEEKLKNFFRIRKESDFYDMSYSEKRKKDKTFGKMIKNHKKVIPKRGGS